MQPTTTQPTTMQPTTIITSDESSTSVSNTYPTVEMVIAEVHSQFGTDSDDYDEETVCEAISKWDTQFAEDPDWIDESGDGGNDIRDELRFDVEDALGLEF